jgi:hypothetical protein
MLIFFTPNLKKINMMMLRLLILLFFASLLLVSCSTKNNIHFGYLECLKPEKNEKQLTITKLHLDFYEKYLFVDSTQILLNRVISKGNNYTYISLSTNCTPEKFELQMKKNRELKFFGNKKFENNQKKFNSFLIKNRDYFFNRITYIEPEIKDLIVFDYITQDSIIATDFFNNEKIFTKKINCDEDE